MVGVMELKGRLPGAMALAGPWMRPNMLGAPILEAKSSISSFKRKPREPAVTWEPKLSLRVVVTETALPSASTTEKWVVSWDSTLRWPALVGAGGRNPAGRTRLALGLAEVGSMVVRQAFAYGTAVSAAAGMVL